MQAATCMVRVNETTVQKRTGVTPAEALILKQMFEKQAGGIVIQEAVETETLNPRRAALEVSRLRRLFKARRTDGHPVDKLWPGQVKNLPTTFAEIGVKLVKESSVVIAPTPDESSAELARIEAAEREGAEAGASEAVDEAPEPPKEHWKTRQKREAAEAAAKAAAETQATG